MSRPIKRRNICSLPENNRFGPFDIEVDKDQFIKMRVDEYETIRLIDLEGFTQAECAEQMNVVCVIVQGIYTKARKKLAKSLVNNKVLIIEGGEYQFCDGTGQGCGRGCQHKNQGRGKGLGRSKRQGRGRGRGLGCGQNPDNV